MRPVNEHLIATEQTGYRNPEDIAAWPCEDGCGQIIRSNHHALTRCHACRTGERTCVDCGRVNPVSQAYQSTVDNQWRCRADIHCQQAWMSERERRANHRRQTMRPHSRGIYNGGVIAGGF